MSELAEQFRLSPVQTEIDKLLDEHIEASETLHCGAVLGVKNGNATWGLDLPATWTEDHQRLSNLLRAFHDYAKQAAVVRAKIEAREQGLAWARVSWKNDYWHLSHWYFLCVRRREPDYILAKDKRGRLVPRLDREGKPLQRVRDGQKQWLKVVDRSKAEPVRVFEAVKWLEVSWSQHYTRKPKHVEWEKLLERAA